MPNRLESVRIGPDRCESAHIGANEQKKKGRIGTSEERRHVVTSPVQVKQP